MTTPPATQARTGETGASLHRQIIFAVGLAATALVGLLAATTLVWLDRLLDGHPDAFRLACYAILGSGCALLALILAGLAFLSRFLSRRVSNPAAALAAVAERVAEGDLAVRAAASDADDELGRLSRATDAMIVELRRLVSAIRDSAGESASMATQITASGEQMAAAAAQMATTSNDLSHQSTEMAQTLGSAASDAATLMRIAERLTEGARHGVERNKELRALAQENRTRLDESAGALEALAENARLSAQAAEAVAQASEEVRAFVTLVRKMSRQSKLLALNAAMEAARAGEAGRGFGVVATEIRKLAVSATEAAQRTERTVNDVLARVQESRDSSVRTLDTVASVGSATRDAISSFAQVERAVLEAESWTASIAEAATDSGELVGRMTARLDDLSRGTESFAAAMQQVAASTEQQSASTEQIAATAAALAASARQLRELVATFRLEERPGITDAPEAGLAHSRPLTPEAVALA